jgi:hypothetical protein
LLVCAGALAVTARAIGANKRGENLGNIVFLKNFMALRGRIRGAGLNRVLIGFGAVAKGVCSGPIPWHAVEMWLHFPETS